METFYIARILFTVLAFSSFVGVVWWAYGKKRQSRFAQAERLALND